MAPSKDTLPNGYYEFREKPVGIQTPAWGVCLIQSSAGGGYTHVFRIGRQHGRGLDVFKQDHEIGAFLFSDEEFDATPSTRAKAPANGPLLKWKVVAVKAPCAVSCICYAREGDCPHTTINLLRAIAPAQDGIEARVFEAPNPEALLHKIEQSGLVTDVPTALWLGQQIEHAAWDDA